jgi:hypothetical protein
MIGLVPADASSDPTRLGFGSYGCPGAHYRASGRSAASFHARIPVRSDTIGFGERIPRVYERI